MERYHVQNDRQFTKFPQLSDLGTSEFAQNYPTRSLLARLQHPFWQEALYRAETPISRQDSQPEKDNPFLAEAALAIRALDRGMINLPLDKKLLYVYAHLAAHPLHLEPTTKEKDRIDIDQLFPFQNGTKVDLTHGLADKMREENGRYKRFQGYIDALREIQAAGRPDILLVRAGKGATYGGSYSEFDYWIEQNVKKLIDTGRRISQSDLAQSIPSELDTHFHKHVKERIYDVDTSLRRLRRLERIAPDLFSDVMKVRETILSEYLDTIEGKILLRGSISEFGEQIGVGYDEAQRFIREYEEKHGITIHSNERPKKETVALAHYILEAVDVLERPGHRWEQNQISNAEIASYIIQAYPEFRLITKEQVFHTIRRYLDISVSTQYPEMPTRRLVSRDSASTRKDSQE